MYNEELIKYEQILLLVTQKLDSYFENQKEYIYCKAGCNICCKNSYYPTSELEYKYVKIYLNKLNNETKELINKKALNILDQRKEFIKTNSNIMEFNYECPFLINEKCCIYSHRPLVCRSYGLIYHEYNEPNKTFIPYCTHSGLNYSNIYNTKTKKIDLVKSKNYNNPPQIYNTSYSSLMKMFENFNFGDIRMLYEFIILDIPDYKTL